MKPQTPAIRDLFGSDGYVLVVLDSCRCDYLQRLVPETECRESPADNTIEWFEATFPDTYDATYVTSQAVTANRKFKYVAQEHFADVIKVWKWSDGDSNTATTEAALNHVTDRMVVHYANPHSPYKGVDFRTAANKISEGELTVDEVRNAYFQELKDVWTAVERLISNVRQRVVVTADHGELLGEDGTFGHGEPVRPVDHPKLFAVPWLDIPAENNLLNDRLETLGYK